MIAEEGKNIIKQLERKLSQNLNRKNKTSSKLSFYLYKDPNTLAKFMSRERCHPPVWYVSAR